MRSCELFDFIFSSFFVVFFFIMKQKILNKNIGFFDVQNKRFLFLLSSSKIRGRKLLFLGIFLKGFFLYNFLKLNCTNSFLILFLMAIFSGSFFTMPNAYFFFLGRRVMSLLNFLLHNLV